MDRLLVVLVLACVLPSCGDRSLLRSASNGVAGNLPAPAPPEPAQREDGRLPPTAVPRRYALSLHIDPTQPRFSGVTTVDLDVPQATSYVVLHARDMHVSSAVARTSEGEIAASATTRLAHGGVVPEELVLAFARPLRAGAAELEIAYDAPFATDLAGLYRVQEAGRWYAFTQFEANDARRAFPCFDEPAFKTAYDVTLTTPRGPIALANTEEEATAEASDGSVVHHFATTRPLPSYLVAFAVGEFEIAEGPREPFPIRVVTTRGKSHLAGLALEVAAALIAKLGEYFDVRYPYSKLDLVAVPDFAAGAMENPGLVTFRDVLLLLDPRGATTTARRAQAEVIAHEFAHQWFGDLVTMRWWDDLWLNEGFATWAEAKMVDSWKPSFGAAMEAIAETQHVMDLDSLKSAHAVREPVTTTSEAIESFDGIAYDKGAAVLRMIESWLGPDVFRRGVQRYIHENAWKNARAEDLFAALDFVSAQHVAELASGFLDQSGVPEVQANLTCGTTGSKLVLRESEWRPLGAADEPPRTWILPVCESSDTAKTKTCFTLGAEPIARDLGPRCPGWIYPNAGEAGYYRFLVTRKELLTLARSERDLRPVERLGLVSNAWAQVRQGALEPGTLLDVLPMLDAEPGHSIVEQTAETLRGIDDALVEEAARPAFRRYAAARMALRKASVGWEARARDGASAARNDERTYDDDRSLERRAVLTTLAEVARDKTTLAEAERYAARWLTDPSSIPADTAAIAVPAASILAGPSRLEQLRTAAKNAGTPEERVLAIRAMGTFDDPAVLRKALDLGLTDEIKMSELRYLFGSILANRAATPVLYGWEKDNWPKLLERVPSSVGREILVLVAANLCTPQERDDARAFFVGATQGTEGIQRALDESLEKGALCVALRQRSASNVTRYYVPSSGARSEKR